MCVCGRGGDGWLVGWLVGRLIVDRLIMYGKTDARTEVLYLDMLVDG